MDGSTVAAFLSAVAAIAAAVAAWRGPITAAQVAERLRRKSELQQDVRRFRMNVFAAVMQERAEIFSPEAVRALNSIDVAFSTCTKVREAWAELYQVLNIRPAKDEHVYQEKTRNLLRAMAEEMGIATQLGPDDFARVYFPEVMAQERAVQRLERDAALARLTSQTSPASNTAQQQVLASWPPKPE